MKGKSVGAGVSKVKLLRAIDGSHGFVTTIAKRLSVTPTAVYKMLHKYDGTWEALEEEREKIVDVAEVQLYNHVREGSLRASIFILKTRGKDRGYVERQEVRQQSEIAHVIKVIYENKNDRNSD